ncbi:MAG: rhomboid family intramembrane serine protease [Panacibacter sp.]
MPTIIKNLLIINVLVFVAQKVVPLSTINMDDVFALHTWQSSLFKPWQFITYMFMHSTDDYSHIFFNMLALWMFGSVLENVWGPKRFLTFYMVSGLGAALCHMIVLYFQNQQMIDHFNAIGNSVENLRTFVNKYNVEGNDRQLSINYAYALLNFKMDIPTIGASGAVFGCLAAFGYLFPNDYLYVMGLVPVKAKWLVIIYAGIELFATFNNSAGDNVAHIAHLGGALAGFLMVYFWNKNNKKTFY